MSLVYEKLEISFPVSIQRFDNYSSNERTHWHEEIEIQYIVRGETQTICNLQTSTLRTGDILFVNTNEPHTGNNLLAENTFYCFHINKNFFTNRLGSEHVIFNNHIRDPRCAALLDEAIAFGNRSDFQNSIRLGKLFYDFLSLLTEDHVKNVLSKEDSAKYSKHNQKINDIIRYIEEHHETALTVTDIADHFFMSASHLSHFFRKHSGTSIIQYLNSIRMLRARQLLEQTDLSVGEIAGRVGIDDINYFSRKFRMINGLTPTQYRSLYKMQTTL